MRPGFDRETPEFDMALADDAKRRVLSRYGGIFRDGELELVMRNASSSASRETLVVMPIADFLRVTPPLTIGSEADGLDAIRMAIGNGGLDDVPFLTIDLRLDGAVEVMGHEGRHRAHVLSGMGLKEMPVRIMANDGVGIRWGQTDRRPIWLLPEKGLGNTIRMPDSVTFPLRKPGSPVGPESVPSAEPAGDAIVANLLSKGFGAIEAAERICRHGVPIALFGDAIMPHLVAELTGKAGESHDGESRLADALSKVFEADEGLGRMALRGLVGVKVVGTLNLSWQGGVDILPDGIDVDGDLLMDSCYCWDDIIPMGVKVSGKIVTSGHQDGVTLAEWRDLYGDGEGR